MWRVPVALHLVLWSAVASIADKGDDFCLQIQTLTAIESGPVVFKVVLRYLGDKPIQVSWPRGSPVEVAIPKEWERRKQILVRGYSGPVANVPITLNPGAEQVEVLYLHQQVPSIPKGKARLVFTWPVYPPDVGGKALANPSKVIEVDIQEASGTVLKMQRRQWEAILSRESVTLEDVKHVAEQVRHTRHSAFVPVALLVHQQNCLESPSCSLRTYLKYWAESEALGPADLVEYVCDPKSQAATTVFYYWALSNRGELVPKQLVETMCQSKRMWTRVLTYALFAERCRPEFKNSIQEDLHRVMAEVNRLIDRLDDDQFAVREMASLELELFGGFAEHSLRESLTKTDSPEVKQRLTALIQGLTDHPENVWGPRALCEMETSQSREIAKLLATWPATKITKQVKGSMNRE